MASLANKTYNPYPLAPRISKKKERIPEIDFVRGFDIILMVLYHLSLDLSILVTNIYRQGIFRPINPDGFVEPGWITAMQRLGFNIWNVYIQPEISPLQIIFSGLFMFLCGISCTFSRSNYKRGVELCFVGLTMSIVIEAASVLLGLNLHIYLGIIQSLAIAILVYAILDRVSDSPIFDIGMALLFALIYSASFKFDWNVSISWIRPGNGINASTIAFWDNLPSFLFGWKAIGDDYFSPVLTTMLVFLGAAVGKVFYSKRESLLPKSMPTKWMAPINWLGRHSLEAYILHQPLLYLFLWAIVGPAGYTLAF